MIHKKHLFWAKGATLLSLALITGCSNNPYSVTTEKKAIYYAALGEDPKSMDPSIAYDVDGATVIDTIYPAFYRYHYLKRPFTLELCLGAKEPLREKVSVTFKTKTKDAQGKDIGEKQVTQTGERWTFTVKNNLRYQDDACFPDGKGRAITAADFVYSWKRMADPKIESPVLSFFQDNILGMTEYFEQNKKLIEANKPADYSLPIEGLQLDPKDPYTFTITLKNSYPQLRYLMAMHFTTPIPHEAPEKYGEEFARHPVGCGVFKLKEYKHRSRIVLERNLNAQKEFYPLEGMLGDKELGLLSDAGKEIPFLDEVQFNIVREGLTTWNNFLQGYQDSAGVNQQNYQQALGSAANRDLSSSMKARGIRLNKANGVDTSYFCFNMEDKVVGGYDEKHRKLRQAISLAIDGQSEIDLLYNGLGVQAQTCIPPGLFGYDEKYQNPYRQYDPNLKKAKQLLAEAGYPGGIDPKTGEKLVITWYNALISAAGRQQISLVTKNIEQLGIKLEAKPERSNVFQEKVHKGEFQMMNYGWVADYPDPENFLFLFYGPNHWPGPNYSGYNRPEYNKLFEQMQKMDDGPERLAIIIKMRDMLIEDCPWIYRNHGESFGLLHPWVKNFKSHAVAMDVIKYRKIDADLRGDNRRNWNNPVYWPTAVAVLLLIGLTVPAVNVVQARTNRYVRKNAPNKEVPR